MQERKSDLRIYYGSTILAIFFWSTSYVSTKVACATIPPITLGALRFVIASLVLGMLLLLKNEMVKPALKDAGSMAISGLFGITMFFTLQNLGIKLTTASNAALIVASYPAITSLLEAVIYRVKITRMKMMGILLAFCGIYLLSYIGGESGARDQFLGNMLMLASGFVWAFYNFITRKEVNKYPAVTVSFYQTVAGTIFFLPLALFERSYWQVPDTLSIVNLFYLGVTCSVAAFLLYNFGLRKLSPSSAVSMANLVPIFGAVISFVLLHEVLTLRQLLGVGIVLLGVYLSSK